MKWQYLIKKIDSLVASSNRESKKYFLKGVKMKFMQCDPNRHCHTRSYKLIKGYKSKTYTHLGKITIRQQIEMTLKKAEIKTRTGRFLIKNKNGYSFLNPTIGVSRMYD